MITRYPDVGERVKELLHEVIVEHPSSGPFQSAYEIIRLKITPLVPDNAVRIARAIKARQNLHILPNGNLLAEGSAPALARSVERRIARLPALQYEVEMRWEYGREHPRIYCLSPVINEQSRPLNKHMFQKWHPEQPEAQLLCVYGPHEVAWQPGFDDPYHLLVWIATYLACDAIQMAIGEWIGKESSHSLPQILRQHGQGKCWCGSGRLMSVCCGQRSPVLPVPRWARYPR